MIISSESCLPLGHCSSTAETRDGGLDTFETEATIQYFLSRLNLAPQEDRTEEEPAESWPRQQTIWVAEAPITDTRAAESRSSTCLTGRSKQSKFTCSHGLASARVIPLRTLRRELEMRYPPGRKSNRSSLWLCWGEEKSRLRAICETVLGRALSSDSILRQSPVDWTLVWRHKDGKVETRPVWVVQKSQINDDASSAVSSSTNQSLACSVMNESGVISPAENDPFRDCYGKSGRITLKYQSYDPASESHLLLVEPRKNGAVLRSRDSRLSQAKKILFS